MSNIETLNESKLAPRDEWKGHLERWQGSGLNQSEYCRLNGLKPYQFTYWKKRLLSLETKETEFVNLPLPSTTKKDVPFLEVSLDSNLSLKLNLNFNGSWTLL